MTIFHTYTNLTDAKIEYSGVFLTLHRKTLIMEEKTDSLKGGSSSLFLGSAERFRPFRHGHVPASSAGNGKWFGCSTALVQLGLTTGLVGLAAGQLVFGPISDKYGRRKPLICAMLLFIIATAGCIFAADIHQFVVMRLSRESQEQEAWYSPEVSRQTDTEDVN